MCKSIIKTVGKVLSPALSIVDDIFGRNGKGSSVTPTAPTAPVAGPVTIPTPIVPVRTKPVVAKAIQKAVEKERVDFKFGTEGLPSLLTEKKRGRNFGAGTSTNVKTLGVRLGQ